MNQVTGMSNIRILVIGLFVFSFYSNIYSQEYKQGIVVSLLSTNQFELKPNGEDKTILVSINDTNPISKDNKIYSDGIDYLSERILNKKVHYVIEKIINDRISVSIIYNCESPETNQSPDELPCNSANFLDIELMKLGFVKYVGENQYLKGISTIKNK